MSRARMERRAWKKFRCSRVVRRILRIGYRNATAPGIFGVASAIHGYVYGRFFDENGWVEP